MTIADTTKNETYMLVIEQDGDDIRDLAFETESGERWPAFYPYTEIFQREDGGGWMISWENGGAGPFESHTFAQAVAEAMREGIIEPAKPLLS